MKFIFCCILTYIFICTSRSAIFPSPKANVLSLIKDVPERQSRKRQLAINRATLHRRRPWNIKEDDDTNEKAHFKIDPVLSHFRRHGKLKISRRQEEKDKAAVTSTQQSSSSSREFRDFKDQWREHWIEKKFEAVNSSYLPGDTVNMAAARPWGVPCGDPNQHDMPWGTCMLPMECDAEYRIYRGDHLCGRTQFVCCALQLTAYDMYQGFDLSFDTTDLATDTEERKKRGRVSKEDQKKTIQKRRQKRKKARDERKREIERHINKIKKELAKLISRQARNATMARKRKTKQLKKFIEMLKKQYRTDRKAVVDLHESEMIRIDAVLKRKLEEIRVLNHDFVKNATFRDIIVNGTLNRQAARMLVEAYPELETYVNINVKRRSGSPVPVPQDYLDYDVEYALQPKYVFRQISLNSMIVMRSDPVYHEVLVKTNQTSPTQ